jgi:O-antigen/teichoic acid export membrane protein
MAVFAQQLDFRRDFLIDALAKLLSLVVAATFAFLLRSYWAIAVGMVTTAVSMMVISYVLAPYKPAFSLLQYRYFLDILGWNTLSQIMQSMNWQLNRILLPRFIDLTTFGRFTMASNLADVPQQALAQPIVRPLVAGFATASNDQARNTAYLNASFFITLTIAPIFMGLGILADPLVPLLLGEKWSHAASFLCYLCLINILTLPSVAMPAMAVTLRATKFVAVRTGVELLVRIPVLVVSIRMAGVAGAIFTQAITTALSMLVSIWVVRRLTGISALSQILTVGRPLLALVPAGAALAAANLATASMSNMFMRCGILFMSASIAVAIYFSLVVLVGRTGWFPRIASEEKVIERLLVRFKQRSIGTTDDRKA